MGGGGRYGGWEWRQKSRKLLQAKGNGFCLADIYVSCLLPVTLALTRVDTVIGENGKGKAGLEDKDGW